MRMPLCRIFPFVSFLQAWVALFTLLSYPLSANSLAASSLTYPATTAFVAQHLHSRYPIDRTRQQRYQVRMFVSNDDEEAETNDYSEPKNEAMITREMFMQHMLGESSSTESILDEQSNNIKIKKKKNQKGGFQEYKVYDNRDTLPFAVKLTTPDPYTHPDIKKQNVKKTKKRASAIEEQITSKILLPRVKMGVDSDHEDDTSLMTVLGEYSLDKHTTTGDSLLINDVEYKVLKHRCLYKYAGGQRFVMIKKILEVKEITRIQTEQYLMEQLQKS